MASVPSSESSDQRESEVPSALPQSEQSSTEVDRAESDVRQAMRTMNLRVISEETDITPQAYSYKQDSQEEPLKSSLESYDDVLCRVLMANNSTRARFTVLVWAADEEDTIQDIVYRDPELSRAVRQILKFD